MLQSNKPKQISKADMEKKVEAWKTINSVLVQANSEFMHGLSNLLAEKEIEKTELEKVLQEGNATEDQNAEYLFIGGYVQCLKDILNAKKTSNN
jgi:hypothetical protein